MYIYCYYMLGFLRHVIRSKNRTVGRLVFGLELTREGMAIKLLCYPLCPASQAETAMESIWSSIIVL